MPAEAKLRWLEEANQLIQHCLSAEQLARWKTLIE